MPPLIEPAPVFNEAPVIAPEILIELDHFILELTVVSTVKICPSDPIGIVVALFTPVDASICPAAVQSLFNFNEP